MSVPGFQQRFHEDWGFLQDAHVRSLAWLLTSPHLLDRNANIWAGALQGPEPLPLTVIHDYLSRLDRHPESLHQLIGARPVKRLGLYAEILFLHFLNEFFHVWRHGLQIRDDKGKTIGEFDFLVQQDHGLVHWELASKFYLFCKTEVSPVQPAFGDYLGPNLSDTLEAKIHKMLQHQLRLGQHEFAQSALPEQLLRSQAWIKGWLFYSRNVSGADYPLADGIAADHCRGWIWTVSEFERMTDVEGVILERLCWLAPAACAASQIQRQQVLMGQVREHFLRSDTPLLLAEMERDAQRAHEVQRAMLVPDDWFARAQRSQHLRQA